MWLKIMMMVSDGDADGNDYDDGGGGDAAAAADDDDEDDDNKFFFLHDIPTSSPGLFP